MAGNFVRLFIAYVLGEVVYATLGNVKVTILCCVAGFALSFWHALAWRWHGKVGN